MKRPGTLSALLATVTVVLAITGCGGSSGVTPAAYVKSLCTTLTTWKSGVQTAASKFQSGTASLASIAQVKQGFQTFIVALVSDTATAGNALKAAGVPSVSGGGQLAGSLVTAFSQADTGLKTVQTEATQLSTSSGPAFKAGLAGVDTSIKSALSSIQNLKPTRKDPQLHAAAQKEPACVALRSST